MPYRYPDVHKEICLTCHYFDSPRRIVIMGGKVFIEHDEIQGICKLRRDDKGRPFPCSWGFQPRTKVMGCRYKRWLELP
ncbi:MAG: hypothetical protein GX945_06175 [Lentisphaerae bacterium]|jgi:hypothetical protein|nr:hypothetical protein [Lentisphaerota bacterium]